MKNARFRWIFRVNPKYGETLLEILALISICYFLTWKDFYFRWPLFIEPKGTFHHKVHESVSIRFYVLRLECYMCQVFVTLLWIGLFSLYMTSWPHLTWEVNILVSFDDIIEFLNINYGYDEIFKIFSFLNPSVNYRSLFRLNYFNLSPK